MGSLSWGFTGSDGVIFVTGLRFEGAWCLSSLLGFGMLRFGSRFVDVEKGSQYVGVHMFKGEKEKTDVSCSFATSLRAHTSLVKAYFENLDP